MENPAKEKAVGGNPTAYLKRHSNPTKPNHTPQSNLDKSGLMPPAVVLDALGVRYERVGGRLAVYCPFHKGGHERNPSLAMHAVDGHYKCFSCGQKGGDVIAFYRSVTGAGFVAALMALGVHYV